MYWGKPSLEFLCVDPGIFDLPWIDFVPPRERRVCVIDSMEVRFIYIDSQRAIDDELYLLKRCHICCMRMILICMQGVDLMITYK